MRQISMEQTKSSVTLKYQKTVRQTNRDADDSMWEFLSNYGSIQLSDNFLNQGK